MKQLKEKNKGITLIALVIIIIVLLILAAVSISTLTGDNGILSKATDARTLTEEAEAREDIIIAVSGSYGEEGFNLEEFKKQIVEMDGRVTSESPLVVEIEGYKATLNEETGKIETLESNKGVQPKLSTKIYQENGEELKVGTSYTTVALTIIIENEAELGNIDEIKVTDAKGETIAKEENVIGEGYASYKVKPNTTVTVTVKATTNGGTKEETINVFIKIKDNDIDPNHELDYESIKLVEKASEKVQSAYLKMGFKIVVDESVSYVGNFDARNRTITLKAEDEDQALHELGHYLIFMYNQNAANDGGTEGQNAYTAEKDLYTGDRVDIIKNASEYMAESCRDYWVDPGKLESERPQTYELIKKAINGVTLVKVQRLMRVYAAYWE